jgi:hypothetical protein
LGICFKHMNFRKGQKHSSHSSVLIHLDCYNKNTINCWLINNRNSFLRVLEAKAKVKMPADSLFGEDLSHFWFNDAFSLCAHIAK